MKKLILVTMGVITSISIIYAAPQNIQSNSKQPVQQTQNVQTPSYQSPTTGVEVEFSSDGKSWERIRAHGESELLFGDRKDVRKATSKATLRAKASIAKFLKEELKTTETLEEITKTLTHSMNKNGTVVTAAERKGVETVIESISNSSNAILKGVLVLEQQVNQKDKYVKVEVGISRKTMKTADGISNDLKRDMSKPNNTQDGTAVKQYNNGENETRRSKNYNNF